MKQFLLGLSVSVAFIAGCLASQYAGDLALPDAEASAPGSVECVARKGAFSGDPVALGEQLSAREAAGWRFLAFTPDDGHPIVCFHRV